MGQRRGISRLSILTPFRRASTRASIPPAALGPWISPCSSSESFGRGNGLRSWAASRRPSSRSPLNGRNKKSHEDSAIYTQQVAGSPTPLPGLGRPNQGGVTSRDLIAAPRGSAPRAVPLFSPLSSSRSDAPAHRPSPARREPLPPDDSEGACSERRSSGADGTGPSRCRACPPKRP